MESLFAFSYTLAGELALVNSAQCDAALLLIAPSIVYGFAYIALRPCSCPAKAHLLSLESGGTRTSSFSFFLAWYLFGRAKKTLRKILRSARSPHVPGALFFIKKPPLSIALRPLLFNYSHFRHLPSLGCSPYLLDLQTPRHDLVFISIPLCDHITVPPGVSETGRVSTQM